MADHRLRLASSHMLALTAALANKVTGNPTFAPLAEGLEVSPDWIAECAADLLAHAGASLVLAGAHQPAQVHAVVYAINAFLGNSADGRLRLQHEAAAAAASPRSPTAIKGARSRPSSSSAATPPTTRRPTSISATLQKSVAEVIRFGYYADETSALRGPMSRRRIISSPGAMPARSTARSCRSSR
jgi:hypothetical protein